MPTPGGLDPEKLKSDRHDDMDEEIIQVRMLLDEGADKGLVDLQGMTAKDHAKEKECVTIIGKKHHHDLRMITIMALMLDRS